MDPSQPVEAAQLARSLARQIGGMRDTQLEVRWAGRRLREMGAATATDVLAVVLVRTEKRDPTYQRLLLRISLALSEPRAAPLRRAIAGLAAVRGQKALAQLLGGGGSDEDGTDDDSAHKVPDFGTGRPLTLGERKSLARRRDRNLLARVLRDPHPEVIRILLGNPALTEENVVQLAARRPVPPGVLLEIFRNPRWAVRARVRLTLALNPHTPPAVALQLLPHLTAAEKRQVARAPQIAEAVRDACRPGRPADSRLH